MLLCVLSENSSYLLILIFLFLGAKVRRFLHPHNPLDMSFRIPHAWYFTILCRFSLRFKKEKQFPKHKFQCVYSDELLKNMGHNATCGTEQCMCPKAKNGPGDPSLLNHEWCSSKAQINGTLAHITAIFGFMLAGLVIQDATK